MEYEKINLNPQVEKKKKNSSCGCKEKGRDYCDNKINLNSSCGTPEYFLVNNYFSELVHEWEKEAARYNLGIQELEGIEYQTTTTDNGEILTKVIFKYRKGHELITREFICSPKGEPGEPGRDGRDGDVGPQGEQGPKGDSPTLTRVVLTWVDDYNSEGGTFEQDTNYTNAYYLNLRLKKPNVFSELSDILTQINNELVANYVTLAQLPDFTTFVRKSENVFLLRLIGNTLNLIKNGVLEDSVNLPEYLIQQYVLPRANDDELGGIKTGYNSSTARHYAVCTDGNGRAYVVVPWTDTTSDNFNIYEWEGVIKQWQNNAVTTLRDALNDAQAQISALKSWKVNVTDENGNIISTYVLTEDKILQAINAEGTLSGFILDVMQRLNSLILVNDENNEGAYLILKLGDDSSSTTLISSDNIILDGETIADKIYGTDIVLTGELTASDANISGEATVSNLILKTKEGKTSYYENEATITLNWENDHRVIFVITDTVATKIIPNGCNLIYKINDVIETVNREITLDLNSQYIIINTNKGWRITKLDSITNSQEYPDPSDPSTPDYTIYKSVVLNLDLSLADWAGVSAEIPNDISWSVLTEHSGTQGIIWTDDYYVTLLNSNTNDDSITFTCYPRLSDEVNRVSENIYPLQLVQIENGTVTIFATRDGWDRDRNLIASDYYTGRLHSSINDILFKCDGLTNQNTKYQADELWSNLVSNKKCKILISRGYKVPASITPVQAAVMDNGTVYNTLTHELLGEIRTGSIYNISGKAFVMDYNSDTYSVAETSEAQTLASIIQQP